MKVNADAQIKDMLDVIRNANEAGTETCEIKKYGVENFFIDYNFKLKGDEEIKISVLKHTYSELNIKALKKECYINKGGDNNHFGVNGSFTTFTFYGDYNENTISNLLVITVEDKDADNLEDYLFGATISAALTDIEEFLETDYEQQTGNLRYDTTEQALEKMDCSEFVARFIQKATGLEEVPHPFTTSDIGDFIQGENDNFSDFLQLIPNSDDENFKDIKPGDVFLWRNNGEGHTGVVISYDKTADKVLVIESIGSSGSRVPEENNCINDGYCSCKGCVRKSLYSRTGNALQNHPGWKGYLRTNKK